MFRFLLALALCSSWAALLPAADDAPDEKKLQTFLGKLGTVTTVTVPLVDGDAKALALGETKFAKKELTVKELKAVGNELAKINKELFLEFGMTKPMSVKVLQKELGKEEAQKKEGKVIWYKYGWIQFGGTDVSVKSVKIESAKGKD